MYCSRFCQKLIKIGSLTVEHIYIMLSSQRRDNGIWWIFRWKGITTYYEETENGCLIQIWRVMTKYFSWDLKVAESGEILKAESWKNKTIV